MLLTVAPFNAYMKFTPLSEMTTMLSIGVPLPAPMLKSWPTKWTKHGSNKKIKFVPLSMAEFISSGKKAGSYKKIKGGKK